MKRKLWLIGSSTLLLLVGCSREYESYQIAGVSGKFCVPKAYIVPRISWVPVEVPEGNDFAFGGCWRSDSKYLSECPFPSSVKGGVVSPLTSFRMVRWKELDADSYYKTIVTQAGSLLEIRDGGETIVVSNNRDWLWYVWHKAVPLINGSMPIIEGSDELLATCQVNIVKLTRKNKNREGIFCRRQVSGKDYAINYSFESNERVPPNIDKLDAQMFKQIESWRCH